MEAGYNASDKARRKFTEQERDDETGVDFIQALYFASTQGRFNSPDPLSGHPVDPQSWNRYAYVGNNPLNGNSNKFEDKAGIGKYPWSKDFDTGANFQRCVFPSSIHW